MVVFPLKVMGVDDLVFGLDFSDHFFGPLKHPPNVAPVLP